MPHIVVNGPILDNIDKKRVLVREITEAVSEAYEMPRESIVVVIRGDDNSNVANGGVLRSDRQ